MITSLARIAKITGVAAKAIYATIVLNGGCACRKELMEVGYTSSRIHEAIVTLEAGGFVIRVGAVYRVANFPPTGILPADGENLPVDGNISKLPADGENLPVDGNIEVLLESKSKRKYSRRREQVAADGKKVPADGNFCDSVNNVVNMNLTNKQANAASSISSTSEIPSQVSFEFLGEEYAFRLLEKTVLGGRQLHRQGRSDADSHYGFECQRAPSQRSRFTLGEFAGAVGVFRRQRRGGLERRSKPLIFP